MNSTELIDKVLREHDISQNELAKLLNVQEGTLSRWKNGIHPTPISALCLIAFYFDIPLADAVDYKAHIAPHIKLKASLQDSSKKYQEISGSKLANTMLAIAEDLKSSSVSYTQLLQDASLNYHQINSPNIHEPFHNGDVLFYKQEVAPQSGYVLFQREQLAPEIYYLQSKGRHILLKNLDIQGDSIQYGQGDRRSGQLLGRIYYLVRSFGEILPL